MTTRAAHVPDGAVGVSWLISVFAAPVKHNRRLVAQRLRPAGVVEHAGHFLAPFVGFVTFIGATEALFSGVIVVSALPVLGSRIEGPSSARR